jgi:hypothetical protein
MSLRRAAAAVVLIAAATAAQSQIVINEGFNDVATLAGKGWLRVNAAAGGTSAPWFQADPSLFFPAQAGPANSYVASNFNNAAVGGTLASWLITPTFSTAAAGYVDFYARAEIFDGFADQLAWGFSKGGSSLGDFTLGAAQTIGGDWTRFHLEFAAQGAGSTGRFAIVYTGPAETANYVGVDTLTVAVPEPETWAMLMVGLAGMGALARRRARG